MNVHLLQTDHELDRNSLYHAQERWSGKCVSKRPAKLEQERNKPQNTSQEERDLEFAMNIDKQQHLYNLQQNFAPKRSSQILYGQAEVTSNKRGFQRQPFKVPKYEQPSHRTATSNPLWCANLGLQSTNARDHQQDNTRTRGWLPNTGPFATLHPPTLSTRPTASRPNPYAWPMLKNPI
jgi:hypothetical protein